jgi:type IV secretory pathway TraG/TraD family ATPase VirD4
MTGSTTIQKASFNFSGSRLSPVMNHVNASVDQVERPLMTPDEVMRLRPATKQGDGATEQIVGPGAMLIFVAGYHPIYGTQILYFSDPILRARAAVAPPVNLIALINGKPVTSLARGRTPQGIGHPDTRDKAAAAAGNGDRLSPMEQAFSAHLHIHDAQSKSAVLLKQPRARLPIAEAYLEELNSTHDPNTPSKRSSD